MQLLINTPRKALKSDFLNSGATIEEIAAFKQNLGILLGKINEIEREENQKNCVRDFLNDTYYKTTNEVNTKGTIDLVIHNGKGSDSSVAVIIEAKKPSNKSEFFSDSKANCKALQELVLYYMRERAEGNNDIKYLIATNIQAWYVIDAQDFERLFYENKKFKKDFEAFEAGQKVSDKTKHFYDVIAKEYIDTLETLPCTYFDLRDYKDALENNSEKGDIKLVELYKLLSPQHLLKVPFANDSNKLNESFYRELLHIIGLEEVAEGSKSIIRRKKENRNAASLMELVIDELKTEGIRKVPNLKSFGDTLEEQTFSIALELCITWINRILFLKLLEGQLTSYHKDDEQVSPLGRFRGDNYRFLNTDMIYDFDELFKLFHKVLAVNTLERSERVKDKYKRVPYLNSSLFEISELEDCAIKINALENSAVLDFYAKTILKTQKESHQKLTTLAYFFQFLDAYDFSGETQLIQSDKKALINASVLGKVFEKINGYKDGSIYTPAFITMYMCREAIRLAVVQKFNDTKQWNVRNFTELHNKISDIKEANAIINDLKICDPAVGSGHFLVSALNEILLIKHELGVLQDKDGKRIKTNEYDMEIINDELIVSEDHIPVSYNPKNKESQRLQETLFTEKQIIIENCLFGVDINPNSVKICRLRLWIELLKNAYYKSDEVLETLPNIDINIKCGNSLLSRFALDADLKKALKSIKYDISAYRGFVSDYKNCKDRDTKRGLQQIIDSIKSDFRVKITQSNPLYMRLQRIQYEYNLKVAPNIFEEAEVPYGDPSKETEAEKRLRKMKDEIAKLTQEIDDVKNNAIYTNAFEWRFEFPEVLDDEGKFLGFDAVIGNPPYGAEISNRDAYKQLFPLTSDGQIDTYKYFIELALRLSKPNGLQTFITSDSYLEKKYFKDVRLLLSSRSSYLLNIKLGDNIFENINLPTAIFISIKGNKNEIYEYTDLSNVKNNADKIKELAKNQHLKIENIDFENTFVPKTSILNDIKCKKLIDIYDQVMGVKVYQVGKGKPKQSEYEKENDVFILNEKKDANHLKFISQGIERYNYKEKGEFINYGEWLAEPRKLKYFEVPKVIIREIVNPRIFATYIEECAVIKNIAAVIVQKTENFHLKYLLALINSNVFTYYLFEQNAKSSNKSYPSFSSELIKDLPIKDISIEAQQPYITLVNTILDKKATGADSSAEEKQIDAMVYALYELTAEEVAIIEA